VKGAVAPIHLLHTAHFWTLQFALAHIRSSDSLVTFQSRLKSHLFSSAYHV